MRFVLTELADSDVQGILTETAMTFGPRQLEAYAAIIETGIAMVAQEPGRVGSLARPELGQEIRFFHLELAAGRRGGAAHGLYYTTGTLADGLPGVIILRVLHQRMDGVRAIAPLTPPPSSPPRRST